jgi:hypothetical protein
MVVVADAGMLSAANLTALHEANLRFIVGPRTTKAPIDLASHTRWHGDAFNNGQIIHTITPKNSHKIENDLTKKAEPVWDPGQHPGPWRAVWAYSANRAARDNKTLTIQENRAREIIAGENKAKTTRLVKNANGKRTLDQAGLERARKSAGLKGYVTNIDAATMPAARSSRPITTCGTSSSPSGCPRPTYAPPHPRRDQGAPDPSCSLPSPSAARPRTEPAPRSATSYGNYGPCAARPSRSTALDRPFRPPSGTATARSSKL